MYNIAKFVKIKDFINFYEKNSYDYLTDITAKKIFYLQGQLSI